MKIYTRTGDKGDTGLLGGARVPKDDPRIEAYGTVDELNSHVGMLRDLAAPNENELLLSMQQMLFTIGSHLASSNVEESARFQVPLITEADVLALEQAMDRMDAGLEPMRNFILPGGHPTVSQAHICRTVCRRAERRVVALATQTPVDPVLIHYLNRASDLFFMLARHLARVHGIPDIPWKPRG
jgi:cob(I)alamin adenosyltransferase